MEMGRLLTLFLIANIIIGCHAGFFGCATGLVVCSTACHAGYLTCLTGGVAGAGKSCVDFKELSFVSCR